MTSRVVVVLACFVAIATAVAAPARPSGAQTTPTTPQRVLVYGDSLSWEAQAGIEQAIEAALPGRDAILRTTAGSATCDALPAMRGADGNLDASVVVLEYVGVPFGPCMTGKDTLVQHTADTQTALDLWRSRGVSVVLVGAPRGVGDPREPTGTAPINRDLAARAGQPYVDAGVLLRDPWTGVYQQRLPCLDGEGPEQGCGADGLIDVRDETGGHFCSIHNVGPCPVYASGIVRFAAPIADAVARAAGVTPPPLPRPPTAAALEESIRSLFTPVGAPVSGKASDRGVAEAALLAADVVPPDFAAQPVASPTTTPAGLATPECRAIRRALKTLDGAARGEAAYAAPVGARVDQVVHVLRKGSRAREVYDAYATPKAARCLAGVVGVPVIADRASKTSRVGDQSITYRATAARNLVIRVVRTGRTVTALTFANAVSPPPPDGVTAITNAAITR